MVHFRAEDFISRVIDRIESKIESGECTFIKNDFSKECETVFVENVNELKGEELVTVSSVQHELNSHQFPDVVINYVDGLTIGVEIKSSTSKGKSWIINGNSVLGSTSVKVDALYIVFFKMAPTGTIEIRMADYESCVSDVVVTHSPRYKIDLGISKEESFFNKSGITYSELNNSTSPIELITDYFKKEGKTAWWLGKSEDDTSPAIITSWSSLSASLINRIYGEAFVLFPELLNGPPHCKYNQLSKWLVSKYSVVDSSLRDKFSAGGKSDIEYCGYEIPQAPKVLKTFLEKKDYIILAFNELEGNELKSYWVEYTHIPNERKARQHIWKKLLLKNNIEPQHFEFILRVLEIDTP
ncbi:hypothetical protein CWE15_09065 [Aliidiomarina taiwanensis]|uniref:Uncharacterized protein n=1 Tax=Aliidiomarina taiwanensis TaxID=946228 RepID=A0A432X143_9GAMM|nr:hypothetical protein [Aliidiomarina taiwanensis]RUO39890.1 hypothetical protein CWE15_09065 [Aliidiomarina taiwanensis]